MGVLLAEYSNYDKYVLLDEFVEIDGTLEDPIRHDIMEEGDLKVKNICYYKSQPFPLSGSLMIGFFCEVDGSDPINYDARELANAGWVEREDISLSEDYVDGSLTYEMMLYFKNKN